MGGSDWLPWDHLPQFTQWALVSEGEANVTADFWNAKALLQQPTAPAHANGKTKVSQVGGGHAVHSKIRFDGTRPIWSRGVFRAASEVQAKSQDALSPPDYPHAASDLMLASRRFVSASDLELLQHPASGAAVFSSISPWVTCTAARAHTTRRYGLYQAL